MKKNNSPEINGLLKTKDSLQKMYRNAKGETRRDLGAQIDSVKVKIEAQQKKEKERPKTDTGGTVIPMTQPINNPAARQQRSASSACF